MANKSVVVYIIKNRLNAQVTVPRKVSTHFHGKMTQLPGTVLNLGCLPFSLFGLQQLYFHGYIHSWTSELPYILSLRQPGFTEKLFQIQASPDLSCTKKEKAKIALISISFVRPVHFNILITCMLVLILVAQHHAIKDTVDCLIVVTVNDPDSVTGIVCDFYHMEILLTRFSHKLKLKKFFFEHCSYGLITFIVRQNP